MTGPLLDVSGLTRHFLVSGGLFGRSKGVVKAVDGVSLTVNEVTDEADGTCRFMLNIIPHTWEVTTLGQLQAGEAVNLEIDVLARYLQRMQALRGYPTGGWFRR